MIDDVNRLLHIIDASSQLQAFIKDKKRKDLDTDTMLGLAVVRLLEIIGEAARGMSDVLRKKYPDIPWHYMASMRNRLIHGYFDVDMDIVWNTVTQELPEVTGRIQAVLRTESGE